MKTKYIYSILLILISIGNIYSQSTNQNYILSRTMTNETAGQYIDQIQYFDGLGRPVQTVQRGITPNKADLVSYQEYDEFGRESNSWLPAVIQNNNGAYVTPSTIMAAARTTNTNSGTADQNPYSRPVYEASPLNRVLEQYGPGADWQSTANKKAVKTEYLTNTSTGILSCALFTVDGSGTTTKVKKNNFYANNELYVTMMTDEDGRISYEFKDKLGQVVLTRQIDGSTQLDTYYVYDDFGNLCFVLPPMASDVLIRYNGSWDDTNSTPVAQYAYLYKYDDRNRCVYKKLPGVEPVHYVYDKADRLIFTQDGEQRKKNPMEWTFNMYDPFGRSVLTGRCTGTASKAIAVGAFDTNLLKAEYTGAAANGSDKLYGYTLTIDGQALAIQNNALYLINYYDNYKFRTQISTISDSRLSYKADATYGVRYGDDNGIIEAKGMLTGSIVRQLDITDKLTPICSVMYYDNRSRLIQAKSTNHLGGVEEEYIAYNFTGQPVKKQHVHSATGKTTQTEYYTYEYDHAGRLKTTTHQLQEGTAAPKPTVVIAENSYDELGRLITSKKAGQANLETTYKYNVRSWTKSISSPLFSQTLYYNESYGGSKAQYNGNISAMDWTVSGDKKRGYAFSYDNLLRLTAANYLENGAVPVNTANPTAAPSYKTVYTYDKHGNMKTLVRSGNTNNGIYNTVDNLLMEYTGNQLKYVKDAIKTPIYSLSADFKDNPVHKDIEYTYNKNGAMSKDWNKGIDTITYNSLNLPQVMVINSSVAKAKNYYTYSASGVKLRTEQRYDHDLQQIPLQNTNPSNDGLKDYKITDYVGNIIYETEKTGTTAATNKTRILIDGGYIENGVYYFFLTDHLGNNRVVAKADGTVIQKNHYYPFGMTFAESTNEKAQPYKYNGKELDQMHQLNLYDYEARYYDGTVPRFTTVDPMAEKYYNWSPYAYCANNPMKYIDPTGMDWVKRTVDGVEEYYYDRNVRSQDDVNKKYGEKGGVTHIASGTSFTKFNKDGSIQSQYTFTNDSKENKYGTVTNLDGSTLDNSRIEYGSDFTIFGTSDNSVNAETLHENLFGTSYTGPNNPKDYLGNDSYQYMPKNLSEYPAMMHDMKYDTKGATGTTDALLNKKVLGADIKLAIGSAAVMLNPVVPTKDRVRAAAVAIAFGNISTAKFLMSIW